MLLLLPNAICMYIHEWNLCPKRRSVLTKYITNVPAGCALITQRRCQFLKKCSFLYTEKDAIPLQCIQLFFSIFKKIQLSKFSYIRLNFDTASLKKFVACVHVQFKQKVLLASQGECEILVSVATKKATNKRSKSKGHNLLHQEVISI